MPVSDRTMGWRAGRLWIPHQLFNIIGTAGAATGQSAGNPVVAVQSGAGELSIVQIEADGDELSAVIPIPLNMDRSAKVLGRIIFCHNSTDADAPVWIVKTKFHQKQATLVDLDTSEDVAVTFDAHTCSTTTASLEATKWTDLEWDGYIGDNDLLAGLLIECDSMGGASLNEIEFLGIELMYQIDATDVYQHKTKYEELDNPV